MHIGGNADLADAQWEARRRNASQAYCDTKLNDTVLAMALAVRWPDVVIDAVDPGWVPTRMGGAGAPDDLEAGAETQAWLAVGHDPAALVSDGFLHHRRRRAVAPVAHDEAVQERLLTYLQLLSSASLQRGATC